MNLQTGAFGDPASTETLILFWAKMEELHYPGAGTTKQYLEDKLRREQQQAVMAQQTAALSRGPGGAPAAEAAAAVPRGGNPRGGNPQGGGGLPQGLEQAVDERARRDALAAVQGGANQGISI